MRPTEAPEEHRLERTALLVAAAGVDVEHDRPRRSLLVVVVPHEHRGREPGDVDVSDEPLLDPPGESSVADPVRRSPALDAPDHAARADRLAVARLEVRTANAERHRRYVRLRRTHRDVIVPRGRAPVKVCVEARLTDVDPLSVFSPATRSWFERAFEEPTPAQRLGWPAIAEGGHVLIQAPTGSGKTLAAFLLGVDRLNETPGQGLRLLYVSPLKALNYDIERNLRSPLAGLDSKLQVAVRTGDTPAEERRRMLRTPPDILITTPESLFLLLTSQARETLRGVETVILDEVHAVAGTKRGAHLALSLERLEGLVENPFQRIGLSATQRPLEEIGRFVAGTGREIRLVDAGVRKELDLQVVVPVEDMRELGSTADLSVPPLADGVEMGTGVERSSRSIWPSIYPAILELVRAHRSTIVFVNNRRLAERLALRINELAEEELARAHHGSLAREQRVVVEELLKAGRIPCLVATSSLELGIDMGAVDLVIQVESPKSVARGLQRVGRAGHDLHSVSKGRIFPKFRADLLESAVVARAMRAGEIEETRIPRNPLDVLAQQIVAICADEEVTVDDLHRARPPRVPLRRALPRAARERPRHAGGPLPLRRVRRAPAADRLGPDRQAPCAAARARAGSPSRTRGRSRTAASSASSSRTAAAGWGSSTRRWSTRHARARPSSSARRPGASTRSRATACSSRRLPACPASRRSGKGEGVGRPAELGEKIGKAVREIVALRDDLANRLHRGRLRPRRACCAKSPGVPARAGTRDRRRPLRPDGGRRALSRRDRRLARLHPLAVRRPRARAVGDGAALASARVARSRRAVAVVGRRNRAALSRFRHGAAARRPPARRRTRSRISSSASSRSLRCTERASARTPPARS